MLTITSKTYFHGTTVWMVYRDGKYLQTCKSYKEAMKLVAYCNATQGY